MVTTRIKPASRRVEVEVPEEFIGQDVQIVMFVEQKKEEDHETPRTMKDFWGVLSEEDYKALKAHTEQARKEWDRDF